MFYQNSMRAVVEQNGEDRISEVKVLITKGKDDLTIKVNGNAYNSCSALYGDYAHLEKTVLVLLAYTVVNEIFR